MIEFGDAEVHDLRLQPLAVLLGDEDVLGFEIAMDDAFGVRGVERVHDRQDRLDRSNRAQPATPLEQSSEILALEQLHHDERLAELGAAEVEHAHDRRMAELGRRARFLEQTIGGVFADQIAVDELQRDVDVQRLVVRAPDRAHPTFAEQRLQTVAAGNDVAGAVHDRRRFDLGVVLTDQAQIDPRVVFGVVLTHRSPSEPKAAAASVES